MDSRSFDYAIHSDFLIHWTGKDIDSKYDPHWYDCDKSKTDKANDVADTYIKRLVDALRFGLWMTSETEAPLCLNGSTFAIPAVPKTCFTELKVSESRRHARHYGRLGIGVKRPFVFTRFGRPVVYYGFSRNTAKDVFLAQCASDLADKSLLNFFRPMNSSAVLDYDLYAESEWRILYRDELLSKRLVVDPRDPANTKEHAYFMGLTAKEQDKLHYLVPLDGWLAMVIYPSLDVKNEAQQNTVNGVRKEIERIKSQTDHGNRVERGNWPIELNLDACRNF